MREKYIARSMPIVTTKIEQRSSTYMMEPPLWKNSMPVIIASMKKSS